jgi:hypothetical protein
MVPFPKRQKPSRNLMDLAAAHHYIGKCLCCSKGTAKPFVAKYALIALSRPPSTELIGVIASGTVDPNQHKLHWRSNNPDHSPAFDA